MRVRVLQYATEEPVTLAEVYLQLGLGEYDSDGRPDDPKLELLMAAAREACEEFLGLSLATKTVEGALDEFPADNQAIELPFGPVIEVESFSYGEDTDQVVMVEGDDFVLDSVGSRVTGTWPSITAATNTVRIVYRTGYAAAENTDGIPIIPPLIKQAILVEVEALFNGADGADLPIGVQNLLRPKRVRLGFA